MRRYRRDARPTPSTVIRTFLPPFAITLATVAAGALVLAAASIVSPPPAAVDATPLPPAASPHTQQFDAGIMELAQAAFTLPPKSSAVVDLARLTYAPGASGRPRALLGPLLLTIESGSLTAQLDGTGQIVRTIQPSRTVTGRFVLHAGDSLLVPKDIPASFANSGTTPVVAIATGVIPSGVVGKMFGRVGLARWADDWSPGATVQPLAGGWLVAAPPASATMALHHMNVPPGDQISLVAPGPLILAVETGTLTLAVRDGPVWQQPPIGPNAPLSPGSVTTLLPGDAALLQDEARVTLRNAGSGPVLALVVSVELASPTTPQLGTSRAESDCPGATLMPRRHASELEKHCEQLVQTDFQSRTLLGRCTGPSATPTVASLFKHWQPVSPADRRLASGDDPIKAVAAMGTCALAP